MVRDLDPLLAPDSIAVVGASPDSWYAAGIVENLLEYDYGGELYLVNPSRERAWNRPCYDGIEAVPEPVDLAVVAVPRGAVVDVVAAAADHGVGAALVLTAGFGEADDEGAELEAELAAVADEREIAVCGPNCLGIVTPGSDAVIASVCTRKPEPGGIGLVSQSGALAITTFLERGMDEDIDFAHVVSTGNEADLTTSDYVEYMAADPDVEVICAYIEGLEEPRRFMRVAERAVRNGTAVLAVKVGRSSVVEAATMSHTGSLTGSDDAWNAAFRQAGVERVEDLPDLLWRATAHASYEPPASTDIGVVSTSGGLGCLLADMAVDRGLELPSLSDDTEAALLEMDGLLTFDSLSNPLDIRGQGVDVLPEVVDQLSEDGFDAYVLGLGLTAVGDRAAEVESQIRAVDEATDVPVVVVWTGRGEPDGAGEQPLDRLRERLPVYRDPARGMDALASLVDVKARREALADRPPRAAVAADSGPTIEEGVLPWESAETLLSGYGIELVDSELVDSTADAADAVDRHDRVVMKVDSPAIPHRTDADAVMTGIDSGAAAADAYGAIVDNARSHASEAEINGVLVQPQLNVDEGVEVLVGVTVDDVFGPVLTVGHGGEFVELIDDRGVLVPPVTATEVREVLAEIGLEERLAGYRSRPPLATDALVELIVDVGRLAVEVEGLAELELNPVVVGRESAVAVDALVQGSG